MLVQLGAHSLRPSSTRPPSARVAVEKALANPCLRRPSAHPLQIGQALLQADKCHMPKLTAVCRRVASSLP